jgi:hypothetical protein
MLSRSARDGVTESVLAVSHQGAGVDLPGVTANHQGAIDARQGTTIGPQGVAVNCLCVASTHQGVTSTHQGVAVNCPTV